MQINSSKGYTLIEVIVVMGIFFMLVGSILISTEQVVKYQNALEVESCRNNILIFINKSRLYCRNKSKGGDILFDTINNEIKFKMGTKIIDRMLMPRDFELKDIYIGDGKNYISIQKNGSTVLGGRFKFSDKFKNKKIFNIDACSGYLEIE